VLHGVVYLRSTTGIVAVDGRTGAVRWQTPVRSDWQQIRTDGRRLLIIGWPTEVSDPGTLVTYALDDGHELWRVDYPAGVVAVDAVGHRLYGWRADGSLVALG